ncbi:MAG: helix-turn-helix transcriptional regulator [Firmicutes bacterium]|nr:helix-turn-helix transcriptional regulator [Bacillota bacterium]
MGERKDKNLARKKIMGKRLRGVRVMQNLSLEAVGDKLGKEKSTLSLYETAQRNIDFETLAEYCKLLNISADYILGIVDEIRPISDPKRAVLDKEVTEDEIPPELHSLLITLGKLVVKEQEKEKRAEAPRGKMK